MSNHIKSKILNDKEFNEALGTITNSWGRRDIDSAFAKIDELMPKVTPEMKAQCLLFKGTIRKDQGLTEARKEWLEALPISRTGSFVRACLEYEIGVSFETENRFAEARNYYRLAIETCAIGDEFSGNKQLEAYLALNRSKILPGDKAIISAALSKSWRVLELPGEPDLTGPVNSIMKLCEGFSEQVRRTKES